MQKHGASALPSQSDPGPHLVVHASAWTWEIGCEANKTLAKSESAAPCSCAWRATSAES